MDFRIQYMAYLLMVFTSIGVTPIAHSQSQRLQTVSDPKATYREYLEAVRKNDLQAAMKCWVFNEEKPTKALEVIVGMLMSMRKINLVAQRKLGNEGLKEVLKGWWRDDVTDEALEQARKDIDSALVKVDGEKGELIITNSHDRPAFKPSDRLYFRRIAGQWRLDANQCTGLKPGDDFFAKGTWGPMFYDQMVIMNEAAERMEKGTIKTKQELAEHIEKRIAAMRKKYDEERRK